MTRYIETFFLGILIACTALFLQVFANLISEVFFQIDLSLNAAHTTSAVFIISFFTINALIEEFLRISIIKKRITIYIKDAVKSPLLLSCALGLGFWTFEIALNYLSQTQLSALAVTALPALLIHIAMSLLGITLFQHTRMSFGSITLLAAILHSASNIILYFFVY